MTLIFNENQSAMNQQNNCAAILGAHFCALYPWKAKWRFSLLEMLVQVHPNRFYGFLSLRKGRVDMVSPGAKAPHFH